MNRLREILISNDDGINAKGVNLLGEIMRKYGNVTIVAPLHPQSGKSAALSLGANLYLEKTYEDEGLRKFTFNGTPVDCIKAGINECYDGIRPDIIVSGINHGSNCSVASLYSGTLGACIEGTVYGIPSMGFSLNTHNEDPDFGPVLKFADEIIKNFIAAPPKKGVYLNVNFPAIPADEVKGIRMARRGYGMWVEEFDKTTDENGVPCYVMAGHFHNLEDNQIGDHLLVKDKYISIVPHKLDNTDYDEINRLSEAWGL